MENSAVETATDAGIKLAHFANEVAKAKTLVEDAVEEKKRQAQRMLKRGYANAEDALEDTTYYIKRNPWKSVGIAAGIGAGAGLILGWSCSRVCNTSANGA